MASELQSQPEIASYGRDADMRTVRIDVGPLTLWFSYTTVVAFRIIGMAPIVRQNAWKQTTGKHLNLIDRGDKAAKARRVTAEKFKELWDDLAAPIMSRAKTSAETYAVSPEFMAVKEKRRKVDAGLLMEA